MLNETIEAALEIVAYGLRTADIEVVRDLAPDLPPVWGDADQLHQVFANLFVNAQQALQTRPRRAGCGHARAPTAGGRGRGRGQRPRLPPEIAKRIFDPFFTTKPQGVGTGVGLSVCHGIVAAHGGEIAVETPPGRGRAVPCSRLPRAAADGRRPPPWRPGPAAAPGRILVVDDEPDIAELLADILERDGLEVERALSGREALARLAGRRRST